MSQKCLLMLTILISIACPSCSKTLDGKDGLISGNSEQSTYHHFIAGSQMLTTEKINAVTAEDTLVIELAEIPSSGYLWHYQITTPGALSLVKEESFGPNTPGVYGNTQKHLWKFKAQQPGSNKIIFKKYRDFIGEKATIEEYIFDVRIR